MPGSTGNRSDARAAPGRSARRAEDHTPWTKIASASRPGRAGEPVLPVERRADRTVRRREVHRDRPLLCSSRTMTALATPADVRSGSHRSVPTASTNTISSPTRCTAARSRNRRVAAPTGEASTTPSLSASSRHRCCSSRVTWTPRQVRHHTGQHPAEDEQQRQRPFRDERCETDDGDQAADEDHRRRHVERPGQFGAQRRRRHRRELSHSRTAGRRCS